MTIKTLKKRSSELALASIRDESLSMKPLLPASILEAWSSLAPDVRAALIAAETSSQKTASDLSMTSGSSDDSLEKSTNSNSEDGDNAFVEIDPQAGTKTILRPLERAPKNVFETTKTTTRETVTVEKAGSSTVTTKKTIIGTTKGWRNVYTLPISYDVDMIPRGTMFDPDNLQLLESTGIHTEGYNTRFAVIDEAVDEIYGERILNYFKAHNIVLHTIVIPGGEPDKRNGAVDKILDSMCVYKLRRREPFLAIGGGCVLDIAGMAATVVVFPSSEFPQLFSPLLMPALV